MEALLTQTPWLAVIIATASAFILGGIWYGPLFKNAWCRENGTDPKAGPNGHPAAIFGVAILCAFLAAVVFAHVISTETTIVQGLATGLAVGFFFVAMSFAINYAFAQRSLKLWLIDAGYHILQFALYGVIIAAMN